MYSDVGQSRCMSILARIFVGSVSVLAIATSSAQALGAPPPQVETATKGAKPAALKHPVSKAKKSNSKPEAKTAESRAVAETAAKTARTKDERSPLRRASVDLKEAKRERSSTGDQQGAKKEEAATKIANKAPARAKGAMKPGAKPCLGEPLTFDKLGTEKETITLLDCKGAVRPDALKRLSILARPWSATRPKATAAATPKGIIAPRVRLLDEGLLVRLDQVAKHFPGKSISVVSGYRPESNGSLHQRAQAIDFRVSGVSTAKLVEFCRTIPDTGCGFYPTSQFVHMDVRPKGTGHAYWIDVSGPGEQPNYVAGWPLPAPPTPAPAIPSPTLEEPKPEEPIAPSDGTFAMRWHSPAERVAP